jgi:hypothetical protein
MGNKDTLKTISPPPLNLNNQLALEGPQSLPSLQDEIDILRSTLKWLRDTFSRAESTEQRIKLSNSMCLVSASLSRLLRTQSFLLSRVPSAFDQSLNQALSDILQEWGRT